MTRLWANLSLRSLRVQVLLWTIAPLTILLIVFSLSGISSHQASMRQLAADENTRLALAIAQAVADRAGAYAAGLQASAHLLAHHLDDPAALDAHLHDTSQVLDGLELLVADREGGVRHGSPAWGQEVPALLSQEGGLSPAVPVLTADGQTVIWGVVLPGRDLWLLAGAPVEQLGLPQFARATAGEHPSTVALVDSDGRLLDGFGPDTEAMRAAAAARRERNPKAETTFGLRNRQEYVTTYAPVPGTGWQLVLNEPWHGLAAPMIRFEEAMPAVLLISVAVSFLTLLFGLLFVVRPLRALGERTRQIGLGNFTEPASGVGGVEEIEELRLAIDQMAQQVQGSQAGMERYLHAVTRAQEEERLRLARELHDETVQTLIAVDHKAQKVQRALERDPSRVHDEVAELRRMAASATAEVRRFTRALRPIYLEELGLSPALALLAEESSAGYTLVGEPRRLTPDVELALYRIAQESLSNARRHAQAGQVEVTLTYQPGRVRLAVCDDGAGFQPPASPAALTRSGHFGLLGMYERAQLAGGQLEITAAPGQGTAVVVTVAGSA